MNDLKYYIAQVPEGDQYPFFKMDKDSLSVLERGFIKGVSPPLKFKNAWREENDEEGISEVVGDVLFSGSQILVSDSIKNDLLKWAVKKKEILPVDFYPAIYIDDTDAWHEAYWYVDIDNLIDCWDRKSSEYRTISTEGEPIYQIQKFSIEREKLKGLKGKGVMFKIDNNVKPPLVLREDIVVYFDRPEVELVEL